MFLHTSTKTQGDSDMHNPATHLYGAPQTHLYGLQHSAVTPAFTLLLLVAVLITIAGLAIWRLRKTPA